MVTGSLHPCREGDGSEGGRGVGDRGEEYAQAGEDEVNQEIQQALPLPPHPPLVGLPVGAQDGDVLWAIAIQAQQFMHYPYHLLFLTNYSLVSMISPNLWDKS